MPEPVGVLAEIVARKRQDVAARVAAASVDSLRARAAPTSRSLRAALARPGARFVLEVKRASPSQGRLRAALDPAEAASAYEGVADAISVLTDGPWFGGSFEDLRAVRARTEAPVLCKDFVLSPYQVTEARAHGADAVLLMLSVLDDEAARECAAEAERLGMDCLVEVHTEAELARAVAMGAPVIGINNRDLRTLEVDLAVTERLGPLAPRDRLVVSESGIHGREDVARLAPYADAFLVGSSLMRQRDLGDAARALVYGRVKVCGLTRESDVIAAREAGATFGGLIFVPDSPRAVSLQRAEALAEAAGADGERLSLVGVFRDAPTDEVGISAYALGLAAVQLHGREDEAYVSELRKRLPEGCEVWGAVHVPEAGAPAHEKPGSDRPVFDTSLEGGSGGTGRSFDWLVLGERQDLARGLLAGGLGPHNARVAQAVGAWALDASSGLEDAPGRKSPEKLAAMFAALRGPCRSDGTSPC